MRNLLFAIPVLLLTACAGSRQPAPRGEVAGPERKPNPAKEAFFRTVEDTSGESLKRGDAQFAQNEYDEARKLYEEAATSAAAAGNVSVEVEALAQVARMYAIQDDYDQGRRWLEKSKSLASPDDPEGWSRYLGVRGRFEWQDEKDNDKAKATFVEMYEYCGEHELFSRQLDAAHMVAIVAPPAEQVEWALNAIHAAENAGQKGWLAVLWNNLGWTYEEQGEYEKMLDALVKARKYHHEVGNDHSKLVADFGVGRAYWRNGRLSEAREWIEAAFETAKQRHIEDPEDLEKGEWVGWGNIYLADILIDEGDPAEAHKLFREGRPYIVKAGIEDWWPEELQRLDAKYTALETTDE